MNIAKYLADLTRQHAGGNATEHTYRPTLKTLLESAIPDIQATNEPKRRECGAPDFVLTRNGIPFGYVETKDIGKNLDDPVHAGQFDRYKDALSNLIITDYLEFRFYREAQLTDSVCIATHANGKIKLARAEFAKFQTLLQNFADYQGQTIDTADDLARRMAIKAKLLARTIEAALQQDADTDANIADSNNDLTSQLTTFRENLIHDIQIPAFADIYAQTIAYGLFAARLHDSTPATFTRQEAAQLIPANNPFLRKFFQHIVGYDLDPRIHWVVNDLADIFRATDVGELMKGYGKETEQNDPFIHFYETFLGAYNPALRKSRGVYYTPEPVVDFIVRAADHLLKTEFGLPEGLADSSKTTIEIDDPSTPKNTPKEEIAKIKKEIHKVQILDPATGTGTFLAHIVRHIRQQLADQKGIWSDYVKDRLIPRLNGFEILMASYAVAHTKLQMEFQNSGCELGSDRLRIFLTNSLEEHHTDKGGLFAQWLAIESREANFIKRDMPVMVVIGNPPYAVSSSNKGNYIQGLIADYKKDLNERKLNLDDDYIKFIRYGEHLVQKTGEGVLAYISNNSFLDGVTHRQMRKHLLETFDKIYVLDLHGNARKRETAPDGSKDQNVFDIMQGVSINLFIKTGKKKAGELAKVLHHDLYGTRKSKYQFLRDKNLAQVRFQELNKIAPYYFFVPKDFALQEGYAKGFKLTDIFPTYSAGIKTKVDHIAVDFDHAALKIRVNDILSNKLSVDAIREKYGLSDRTTWEYKTENNLVFDEDKICQYEYRPFDYRYTYYDKKFISRSRSEIMDNFYCKDNIGLESSRNGDHTFIGKFISDEHFASDNSFKFPLYRHPDITQETIDGKTDPEHNLNKAMVQDIAAELGLIFTDEKESDKNTFAPIDILDYIYAVLHSPAYRKKYCEFLKIDFPRVPYPKDANCFWQLVTIGSELRAMHLMQSPILNTLITEYPNSGKHLVTKPYFETTDPVTKIGKVHINPDQFFAGVPQTAWNFFIGGYQPAQKYLKDRKGRTLNYTDITHYQKIIVALVETERLMQAVDEVE